MKQQWTDEEIVAAIKRCAKERDQKVVHRAEYSQWAYGKEVPQILDIYNRFNNWQAAANASEYASNVGSKPEVSPKQVRASIQRAKKKWPKNQPMRDADYEQMAKEDPEGVDLSVVVRLYGRWSTAAEMNGITPSRVWSINERPQEHWVSLVRTVCQKEGAPLSVRKFNEARPPGTPTANSLAGKFGGWQQLLEAAGYSSTEIEAERELSKPGGPNHPGWGSVKRQHRGQPQLAMA